MKIWNSLQMLKECWFIYQKISKKFFMNKIDNITTIIVIQYQE